MKKLIFSWLLSILFLSAATAQRGEARTGYDGDYFSLEGAIELFKRSHTIDDFERRLNREDSWVNNLDLNYDGQIDYIRVEHIREGKFHAIVLQVPIDRYDVQDVAVIEIEKTGRRRAILQIVGDEDLYGEEVIVEPYGGDGYYNGRGGPNAADYEFRRGYVNVYYWNPVQHIFGRHYHRYVSPWRWSYYPSYWSPWRPCGWNVFRPRIVIFHRHYHRVHIHRVHRVHNFYRPHRHYSHHVTHRTNKVRVKHGKPAIHRTPSKDTKRRKEVKTKYTQIEKGRKNGIAQKSPSGDRDRTRTTTTRTPNKIEKGRTNSSTYKDRKRDRTRTTTSPPRSQKETTRERTRTTTKPSRSTKNVEKGRTNSTRETQGRSRGKVRSNSSSKPSRSSSKANKSTSRSSSKSSSTRSSSRSTKPATSSRKSRSSSSSKKSTRSKSSSKRSSKKGRG